MKPSRIALFRRSGNKIPAHQQVLRKNEKLSFEEVERRRNEHIRKLKERQLVEQEMEEHRSSLLINSANSIRYPYTKPPQRKISKRRSEDPEIFGQNYCDNSGYGNYTPAHQQPCSTSSFTNISDIKQEEEEPVEHYRMETSPEIDCFANQIIKNENPENGMVLKEVKLEPIYHEMETNDEYANLFDFSKSPCSSSEQKPMDLEMRTFRSPSPAPPVYSHPMEQLFEELESNIHIFCQNLKKSAANLTEDDRRNCSERIAYMVKMFRLETRKSLKNKKSKIVKGVILDKAVPHKKSKL